MEEFAQSFIAFDSLSQESIYTVDHEMFYDCFFLAPFYCPPEGEVLPAQMSYTKLFIMNEFSVALISYPIY